MIDAVLAFPMAFYMAKVASPRGQRLLVVAVLTPLWARYLVKAYAWRGMLSEGGVIDWLGARSGSSPGYGLTATVIVLTYLWLPYMILPIYAGLERLPDSLLEASADLGGAQLDARSAAWCCRWSFPAIVAGSIFTFSLSLGDYITVRSSAARPAARQRRLRQHRRRQQPAVRGRRWRPSRSSSWWSTCRVRRTGALENL